MTEKKHIQFWGIINYEIIGDGCLNGVWTNNFEHKGGVIMNEIARKRENCQNSRIDGEYYVSWIEPNQTPINGKLSISIIREEMHFTWNIDNTNVFSGVGLQVGLKNIIAFYWKFGEEIHLSDNNSE